MFFPHGGLGDFYVTDSNGVITKEKNAYLADLIEDLDNLLK